MSLLQSIRLSSGYCAFHITIIYASVPDCFSHILKLVTGSTLWPWS